MVHLNLQPDLAVPVPGGGTGEHGWSATVTLSLADSSTEVVQGQGVAAVVDQTYSAVGSGWGIAGVDRLYIGGAGVLWVSGQGDCRFFTLNSDGTYSCPEDLGRLAATGGGSETNCRARPV